jgi:hypothetical protein
MKINIAFSTRRHLTAGHEAKLEGLSIFMHESDQNKTFLRLIDFPFENFTRV